MTLVIIIISLAHIKFCIISFNCVRLLLQNIKIIPLTALFLLGCNSNNESDRMRMELANIYAHALENPMKYYHMNKERVKWMNKKGRYVPPERKITHRYYLSQELLRSGQTEAAISELTSILSELRARPDMLNSLTRPIFDELALAYLRLGEEINCIKNHSGKSCIVPVIGDGIQTSQENTKRAIEIYQAILEKYPKDLGSRWLLNIAYMVIGSYPQNVPEQYLIRGLDGDSSKQIPAFNNVAHELVVAINGISGGLCIEDFNNDGHLDLFMTSYGLNDPVNFFLADGRGGYTDFTTEAGLDGIVSGLNSIHADYNNDGYTDILILRGAWLADKGAHPNSLLRNNGDGTFTDVTHNSGILSYHPTQTACWADFNLDGYLDLFIGNESNSKWQDVISKNRVGDGYAHPSELYLNNGDGTFTEISQKLGIELDAFVKGATWGDINNDGLPDLFVSINGAPNKLYVNKGGSSISDWHFDEQAEEGGVQKPLFSFPTWFWDYDNDGWLDLLVLSYDFRNFDNLDSDVASEYLNLSFQSEISRLYRNNRDGTFFRHYRASAT